MFECPYCHQYVYGTGYHMCSGAGGAYPCQVVYSTPVLPNPIIEKLDKIISLLEKKGKTK